MTDRTPRLSGFVPFLFVGLFLAPVGGAALAASGQTSGTQAESASSNKQDRWLHIRVENPDSKEETVRVNVPLELAEKILPTINRNRLQSGRVKVDQIDCHGVDVHALPDRVRSLKGRRVGPRPDQD